METRTDLPSKLGLNSVQMAEEQIVEMADFKMSWAPLEVSSRGGGGGGGDGGGGVEPVETPGSKKRRRSGRDSGRSGRDSGLKSPQIVGLFCP